MLDLTKSFKKVSSKPWQNFGEQTLILSPQDQMTYEFSEVGTFIWNKLDGKLNGLQILENITDEFDITKEQAKADLIDFLEELKQSQLVE